MSTGKDIAMQPSGGGRGRRSRRRRGGGSASKDNASDQRDYASHTQASVRAEASASREDGHTQVPCHSTDQCPGAPHVQMSGAAPVAAKPALPHGVSGAPTRQVVEEHGGDSIAEASFAVTLPMPASSLAESPPPTSQDVAISATSALPGRPSDDDDGSDGKDEDGDGDGSSRREDADEDIDFFEVGSRVLDYGCPHETVLGKPLQDAGGLRRPDGHEHDHAVPRVRAFPYYICMHKLHSDVGVPVQMFSADKKRWGPVKVKATKDYLIGVRGPFPEHDRNPEGLIGDDPVIRYNIKRASQALKVEVDKVHQAASTAEKQVDVTITVLEHEHAREAFKSVVEHLEGVYCRKRGNATRALAKALPGCGARRRRMRGRPRRKEASVWTCDKCCTSPGSGEDICFLQSATPDQSHRSAPPACIRRWSAKKAGWANTQNPVFRR